MKFGVLVFVALFLAGISVIGAAAGGAFRPPGPSSAPTLMPTSRPTTLRPTSAPTLVPTLAPTSVPTLAPTRVPTSAPGA